MSGRSVPLVYATPRAVADARRLLGDDVVLELEVERAIVAGRVGRDRVFGEAGAWVAHVHRGPGRVRPRPRAWHVIGVDPLPTPTETKEKSWAKK
jgi:hypothetical protein